eukprot:RCo051874
MRWWSAVALLLVAVAVAAPLQHRVDSSPRLNSSTPETNTAGVRGLDGNSTESSGNVTSHLRLSPAYACTIRITGRSGTNSAINSYYTYMGTYSSMPYYKSSSYYLYYYQGWNVGEVLGSSSYIHALAAEYTSTPATIGVTWQIAVSGGWVYDSNVRAYCSNSATCEGYTCPTNYPFLGSSTVCSGAICTQSECCAGIFELWPSMKGTLACVTCLQEPRKLARSVVLNLLHVLLMLRAYGLRVVRL